MPLPQYEHSGLDSTVNGVLLKDSNEAIYGVSEISATSVLAHVSLTTSYCQRVATACCKVGKFVIDSICDSTLLRSPG